MYIHKYIYSVYCSHGSPTRDYPKETPSKQVATEDNLACFALSVHNASRHPFIASGCITLAQSVVR